MREHPYAAAWRDLERRGTILNVVFWVALPLMVVPELLCISLIFVAFLVFDLFSIRSLPWQVSLFVLTAGLGLVGLSCILLSFRCPRCRQLFFFKKIYLLRAAHDRNDCVHCGLTTGTIPETPSGETITSL